MEPTPTPTLQQGIADDELQRKRRLADRLMEDFLAIEADLLGTPYIRVEVTCDKASWEMMVGRRRRFKVKAA